MMIPAVKDL